MKLTFTSKKPNSSRKKNKNLLNPSLFVFIFFICYNKYIEKTSKEGFYMLPIEKLTTAEKEMFQNYIRAYYDTYTPYEADSVSYYPEDMKSADFILRFWNHNKAELFNIMGENLQIFKKVDMEVAPETAALEKRQAFDYGSSAFKTLIGFICVLGYDYHEEILKDFCYKIIRDDVSSPYLFNSTGLTEKMIIESKTEPNKKLVIHPETKLTKALKMIIKFFDIGKEKKLFNGVEKTIDEIYEKACIEISRLTQNQIKRINGTFLFSIHPLDYLTMSDNSKNWNTCMSWRNGGEYRIGTVEMMNSPVVVEVAYLEEPSRFTFNGFSWNDKKWRTQLIVAPGFISTIKSYPYSCPQFEKYAIAEMAKMYNEYYGEPIFDIGKINTADRNNPLPYVCETKKMYNDIYLTTHYYYYNEEIADAAFDIKCKQYPNNFYYDAGNKTICYSGETECMCCGQAVDYKIDDTGNVFCENCLVINEHEYIYCSECGKYLNEDGTEQIITMSDGRKFCYDCAVHYFYYDEYNDEWLYEEECLFIDGVSENRWGFVIDNTLVVKRENFDIEDFISSYFKDEYKEILIKVFEWYLERGLAVITMPYEMFR